MTEMTTRRGVRPLLALLLTGMALLMMGATRPVQAAQVTDQQITLVKGGMTTYDDLSFSATVTFSDPIQGDGHLVKLVVAYYSGSNYIGTAPALIPFNSPGSCFSPDYLMGGCQCQGYSWAISHKPTSATGFIWYYEYHVSVGTTFDSVVDTDP